METTPLLGRSIAHAPAPLGAGPSKRPGARLGVDAFLEDLGDWRGGGVPGSVMVAFVIGVVCGVAAWAYYVVLELILEWVWGGGRFLGEEAWLWVVIVGMVCAAGVGISILYMGFPGDLGYTVGCVHTLGYVPVGHAPSMVVSSMVSIVGGGSLGPEAPLVAICASIAGWVSMSVFGMDKRNIVRKHTLCGMACALAAFFGVPAGGSLFALELTGRLGYEYFEHALEAILSGTVCLVVFRGLAGLPIGDIWKISSVPMGPTSASIVCAGALLGLLGAGLASLFAHGHWALVKTFKKIGLNDTRPVPLALAGGAGIVVLGLLVPHTMFWGEYEFQVVAASQPASTLPHIFPTTGFTGFEITGFLTAVIAGFAKLAAISFTVAYV